MKKELKNSVEVLENFVEVLKKEAEGIGITLDENKLKMYEIYKNMLVEWNEKINLTSIVDDYQIIMKHFIDCLEIVKYIKSNETIIDVGTGAGFPGLVIAIYNNEQKITLVDALNKRVIFLQDVVEKLGLKNVKIIHSRAEELACNEEYRSKYDLVVSRAVAPLNVLLEYDIPYIKVNGRALLLKSNNFESEIKESKNAINILNCKISNIFEYEYNINDEIFTRKIIELKKIKEISSKYPRNYGKIKKNPL